MSNFLFLHEGNSPLALLGSLAVWYFEYCLPYIHIFIQIISMWTVKKKSGLLKKVATVTVSDFKALQTAMSEEAELMLNLYRNTTIATGSSQWAG